MAPIPITINKIPKVNEPTPFSAKNPGGYPIGIAPTAAWTPAQKTAGMRREQPLGSKGIGTNRVAAPRDQLAGIITGTPTVTPPILNGNDGGGQQWSGWGNSGGAGWGTGGSNRGGYTTSSPGWGGGNSSAGAGYGMGGRDRF